MTESSIVSIAREVFQSEVNGLNEVASLLDNQFAKVTNEIYSSNGRLIISGIGKSAIIAQKIVATLNSTGTPSIFMHAADALHGDLGNVQKDDTLLVISNSGNSPEIVALLPLIKNLGNTLIAMTGVAESPLAKASHYTLLTKISREATNIVSAPTTSTTVQMAMGDALAVALINLRGFTDKDFARNHPGGALGKKLFLKVNDVLGSASKPSVSPDTMMSDVILSITNHRLGATTVLNEKNEVLGIITDGDIRRLLYKGVDLYNLKASEVYSSAPKNIQQDALAANAMELMERNKITQLVVLDHNQYVGLIHLHDLIQEGII